MEYIHFSQKEKISEHQRYRRFTQRISPQKNFWGNLETSCTQPFKSQRVRQSDANDRGRGPKKIGGHGGGGKKSKEKEIWGKLNPGPFFKSPTTPKNHEPPNPGSSKFQPGPQKGFIKGLSKTRFFQELRRKSTQGKDRRNPRFKTPGAQPFFPPWV